MITVDTRTIPITPKVLKNIDCPAWVVLAVDINNISTAGNSVILTDPAGVALTVITQVSTSALLTQIIDPTSPPATTQTTLGATTGGTQQLAPLPSFVTSAGIKVLVPYNWTLSTTFGATTAIQIVRFDSLREALEFMR